MMTSAKREAAPANGRRLILFGAFDRHNFGDLLLARCAAAGARTDIVFTGLAARDLRKFGGFHTLALADAIAAFGSEDADFVHVGGELLTTTAWEAAVMLQSPSDTARIVALHDRSPDARTAWARSVLGTTRRIPYIVAQDDLPTRWRTHFRAVGGVAFDTLPGAERNEILRALRTATTLSVRDRTTFDALRHAGVDTDLLPDPAAATPALFGATIGQRGQGGEIAALRSRMRSWAAVQLAAEWGDDATLDRVAGSLLATSAASGTGIVLYRAGLAPWHDDLDTLRRLADRLGAQRPVAILESAHVLDIFALLAEACAYVGTSLHGWIVAHAFKVPARCLVRGPADKAARYTDTWCDVPRQWRTPEDGPLFPETISG
ncbi:polysaccharide pyruvyl transferase family protein [Aromatoleum toluolicum]|uniref:Polysaccharide pyruvyl transferase family protein n=1 Tax=Aromatoleum toluolicum TaxID=90060 RepID=A0ABX1NDP3_9RHOO|nr:polysaccharide pyruvyl transferase family protein [Aromatoleum toluolicum]NMF97397.1 polysaccharide pyruvyl transferase family protein [Aromatoleum toluolicum]